MLTVLTESDDKYLKQNHFFRVYNMFVSIMVNDKEERLFNDINLKPLVAEIGYALDKSPCDFRFR